MKKFIIYPLSLTVLLLSACKKEKPQAETIYPITLVKLNPLILEYVQLPLNRYFIYKDSANGSIDSVIVTKSIIENKFQPSIPAGGYYPCFSAFNFEAFTLILMKITDTSNQDWFNGIAQSFALFSCETHPAVIIDSNFILDDHPFSSINNYNITFAFVYPFTFYQGQGHILIPSLTIESTTYTDVHEFVSTNGLQPSHTLYQAVIYYWTKGTGIIKKEIRTYNTVKTSLLVRFG